MNFVTIVGNRPQFIKMAAVQRELERRGLTDANTIIHTGQHYDENMSADFFGELDIPLPSANLCVGSGPHGQMTGRMLEKIENILRRLSPDFVMVYGDTNSTLAGALAAAKLNIPVVHVEAGLRSGNMQMAEEVNRSVVDHISDILFSPCNMATFNLMEEGMGLVDSIHQVGDVMYDAFLYYSQIACQSTILDDLNLKPKEYYLATVHRTENIDDSDRFNSIMEQLGAVADGMDVIVPLHPRLKERLTDASFYCYKGTYPIAPVGYIDMLQLERNAQIIITDSGGVQKEAYWSHVPCITLRDETEWVETVKCGANILVDVMKSKGIQDALVDNIEKIIDLHRDPWKDDYYGDGTASSQILDTLIRRFDIAD